MNNQFETQVEVLPLTPASDVKHIVRNVISQPRASEQDGVVAFKVYQNEGTIVEHTVHEPLLLPVGRYSASIQQEVNPLSGILERVND